VSGLNPPRRRREKATPGPLQHAAFTLPKSDGDKDDTQVLIFYSGRRHGGDDANIQRYKACSSPAGDSAKVEKAKAGNVSVTTWTSRALTCSGPAGNPNSPTVEKPDYRMIPHRRGQARPFYVRFIGRPRRSRSTRKTSTSG